MMSRTSHLSKIWLYAMTRPGAKQGKTLLVCGLYSLAVTISTP